MNIHDPLRPESLTREGKSLGRHVIVKEITGSTNDDARALAEAGAEHGLVVLAEKQERGRGREGRVWHSPAGRNLLFSMILRPTAAEIEKPGLITLAAGVAVAQAVIQFAALPARLKWPNDVRVQKRKLAGLLAEAGGREKMEYVILGVGLNVNLRKEELPPELRETATSLFMATGRTWSRTHVFHEVISRLETLWEMVEEKKTAAILGQWQELAEAMDQRVMAKTPGGVVEGQVRGVREDGALLVLPLGKNQPVPIVAGDVIVMDE